VARIAIPDVSRMFFNMTPEYQEAVRKDVGGDGSFKTAIRAAVFEHGHQAAWTQEMLEVFMGAVGFETSGWSIMESLHEDLRGIEQHGKAVGEKVSRVETSVVEGIKILNHLACGDTIRMI
jgi:hypothetical protein